MLQPNTAYLSIFIGLLSAGAFLVGCNRVQTSIPLDETTVTDPKSTSRGEDQYDILEHDFGLLNPGVNVSYRFPIHNSDKRAVTVRRVLTSCTCTVTELSSKHIAAGGCAFATLMYKAGERPDDDRRQLVLTFEEPWARPIALTVTARIRRPLTLSLDQISFGRIAQGYSSTNVLQVENFSDKDWTSISTTCNAQWITTSAPRLQKTPKAMDQPRQAWQIDVTATPDKSAVGECNADLVVVPAGVDVPEAQQVHLSADFAAPIVASPAQLFFGEVKPGRTYKASTTLFFSPGYQPPGKDTVKFQHSLGDNLQLEWKNVTSEHWDLEASLTPTEKLGPDDKFLTIRFFGSDTHDIKLPIYVLLKAGK